MIDQTSADAGTSNAMQATQIRIGAGTVTSAPHSAQGTSGGSAVSSQPAARQPGTSHQ
jgi:hypothetical protein